MKGLRFNALLLAGSLAAVGTAGAGGFSRGTADTDILLDEGNFNMRAGVTLVAPQRGYDTVVAPLGAATAGIIPGTVFPGTDGKYSDFYAVPSAAVKFNLTDDLRCAGTMTTSFGAGSSYGEQAIAFGGYADGTGTVNEGFDSYEFGGTCAYKFDLAKGRAWIIGGAFLEDFSYSQTVRFYQPVLQAGLTPIVGAPTAAYLAGQLGGSNATLTFDGDYEPGFRIGTAYEIPEIALRAQLMYRSEVNHNPTGTFTTVLDGVTPPFPGAQPFTSGTSEGTGTLPQSLELKLQSGVAPGWLAFGSVKWTDWSVLTTLDYTITGGPLPGERELEYYFRDGWTVSGGIGHSFSESISGVIGLTWDRGVSTTEDAFTDSYTLGTGVSLKDKLGGELRFGGAVTYLTGTTVAAETGSTLAVQNPGASFGYSVDGDWAYAASAGYKISW